jgi:hypothetical protein
MEVLTNVIKDILVLAAAPAILIYIFNAYKEFRKLNEERLSVLNALHAELTSLYMLICSRENQYLNFDSDDTENTFYPYISITLNYFSVFDNIASKFGLINNQTTIEQIIKCYVEVKGLFDDVKNLEYYAKMIVNTTSQTNVNQKAALINSYTLNLRSIVYGQLPKAKVLIKQSIQCINDEKNKIESNNTILGFLFF